MKPNLLVLLPNLNDRIAIRKLQKAHLERTGDGSFYIMPPVVIIGYTDKKGVDRKKFNISLEFESKATKTDLGYIFKTDLRMLQEKYSACGPSGLFFTRDKEPKALDLKILNTYSLALLESSEEGYLLLQ
ncbi:MAG: hypothetical protein K6G51_02725 [Sphaerochaetaceae bacterium]|nr:hypothetical protein [Sphaerochaetaceae bacterium]